MILFILSLLLIVCLIAISLVIYHVFIGKNSKAIVYSSIAFTLAISTILFMAGDVLDLFLS